MTCSPIDTICGRFCVIPFASVIIICVPEDTICGRLSRMPCDKLRRIDTPITSSLGIASRSEVISVVTSISPELRSMEEFAFTPSTSAPTIATAPCTTDGMLTDIAFMMLASI